MAFKMGGGCICPTIRSPCKLCVTRFTDPKRYDYILSPDYPSGQAIHAFYQAVRTHFIHPKLPQKMGCKLLQRAWLFCKAYRHGFSNGSGNGIEISHFATKST